MKKQSSKLTVNQFVILGTVSFPVTDPQSRFSPLWFSVTTGIPPTIIPGKLTAEQAKFLREMIALYGARCRITYYELTRNEYTFRMVTELSLLYSSKDETITTITILPEKEMMA